MDVEFSHGLIGGTGKPDLEEIDMPVDPTGQDSDEADLLKIDGHSLDDEMDEDTDNEMVASPVSEVSTNEIISTAGELDPFPYIFTIVLLNIYLVLLGMSPLCWHQRHHIRISAVCCFSRRSF